MHKTFVNELYMQFTKRSVNYVRNTILTSKYKTDAFLPPNNGPLMSDINRVNCQAHFRQQCFQRILLILVRIDELLIPELFYGTHFLQN